MIHHASFKWLADLEALEKHGAGKRLVPKHTILRTATLQQLLI